MSEKRFGYGETDLFEWVEDNGEMISTKECVNKLNEQQATIRRLQDLCGKSDGENAKLRIENKRLQVGLLNEQQSTIEQLEKKLELKTEEVEYLKRMMVKWGMVKDE